MVVKEVRNVGTINRYVIGGIGGIMSDGLNLMLLSLSAFVINYSWTHGGIWAVLRYEERCFTTFQRKFFNYY